MNLFATTGAVDSNLSTGDNDAQCGMPALRTMEAVAVPEIADPIMGWAYAQAMPLQFGATTYQTYGVGTAEMLSSHLQATTSRLLLLMMAYC